MESTGSLSVAKVVIEYHDPSGLFQYIDRPLESRLPLRNLHWKSPRRPLRSIESLHVELKNATGDVSTESNGSRPGSRSSLSAAPVKERRHQIPGLHQTPYLKLYLLRCDDTETYKATQRKAVREWIKSHIPASQSSSSKKNAQENHDAFEWMILHVVLPNTTVSNEQTSPKNRGSGTLIEKIRSDFNVSSKNAPDRVAQIQLSNDQVKNKSQGGQAESQDQKESWDDAIAKTKSLILASFDLRVGQYEEDVKERESQRLLPGWNFCTFFVLKEGLAQGFESVGLVDDALALYEGLDVELDGVLANKDGAGHTDLFLNHTAQIKSVFEKSKALSGTPLSIDVSDLLISSTKKSFRELILANNVSVFDFKTYVLARKMAVLLRMSRVSKETENLIPLGQLCQLASVEIPVLARILRLDLETIVGALQTESDQNIIENIVESWIFTVCQQILDETRSAFLSGSTPSELQFTSLFKEKASAYPSRRSSLNPTSALEKSTDDAHVLFETLKNRASSAQGTQQKSGKDLLAMQRSMLVAIQRRILKSLASKQGLVIGWPIDGQETTLKDVNLDEEDEEEAEEPTTNHQQEPMKETMTGIFNQTLINSLSSLSSLRSTYEKLTEDAMDLYFIAGQGKNFERMLADLAVLKYQSRDYAGAANFFAKIIPVYSQLQWSLLEQQILMMHAQCLKLLNRRDDYVRMLLGILAKAVSAKISSRDKKSESRTENFEIETETMDGRSLLNELLSCSAQLPYEVSVEMSSYFQNIRVEPYIQHYEDREGFQLAVKIRSPFHDDLKVDRAAVVLESINELPARTIQLTNNDSNSISKGVFSTWVGCNVTTLGLFRLRKLQIVCSKINFVSEIRDEQHLLIEPTKTDPLQFRTNSILCYPREDGFDVKISLSKLILLDQKRCLELECHNGPTQLKTVKIKLKSASSGLRLHIADAKLKSGEAELSTKQSVGSISIPLIKPHSRINVSIPFELDDAHKEIAIRVDVASIDSPMEFTSVEIIQVELPLDINVHDLFKKTHIFSRFHIRSATEYPLKVVDLELEGTKDFEVEVPTVVPLPTTIYAKQPGTFMYKIHPVHLKDGVMAPRRDVKEEKPLTLTVDYHCIDEEVQWIALHKFTTDLEQGDYKPWQRLLKKTFQRAVARNLTPHSYSDYTLTQQVHVPSFEEIGWSALLVDLHPNTTIDLRAWLLKWHRDNAVIPGLEDSTPSQTELNEITRSIVITVPLPRLHTLQMVEIKLSNGHAPLTVGEPVTASLTIQHTRHWESPSASASVAQKTRTAEFMYSVEAPLDTWAIGGQRRGRFAAEADERKEWQLILVPLKTGKLLLPSVEVRPSGTEELTCETDFKGAGKTVLVLGNLKRTTVLMSGMEAKLTSAVQVE